MNIILGSQSKRRKEILEYFTLPFRQVSPTFDEESLPFHDNPEEYVCMLSNGKGLSLVELFPDAIIITADTIVYSEGKIYGKPKNQAEAFDSLMSLKGQWHTVYTGVSVIFGKRGYHQAEPTRVLFNDLTAEQIQHYIQRTEWMDKAGGYAIQKASGLIVNRIEGCYYNVMGLPINTLEILLKRVGIELWNYI